MGLAVTHVLLAIILIDIFRKKVIKKKDFSLWLVLLGGIAGLLPDIDIPLFWLLQFFIDINNFHQDFTHNLIIPIILLIIGMTTIKWKNISHTSFVIAAGWTIHILIDVIVDAAPMFYPFTNARFGLYLLDYLPQAISSEFLLGIDAIILILWLTYEWKYKLIRDYI
tara:strand:+ start:2369 stop:2869 length:501 start_codon:yes stop_codon:yes gene_type:complete